MNKEKLEKKKEDFIRRTIEKFGDKFDLSNIEYVNMSTKTKIVCKKHGEITIVPSWFLEYKHGCPKCAKESSVKLLKENKEENQKKIIESNMKKYGVPYSFQAEEVKEKIKDTMIKKYGKENYTQTEEYKKKTKKTNREKYGTDWFVQSDEWRTKNKKTVKEKYGTDNVFQSEDIKNKSKKTMLGKYGVEYSSQRDDFTNICISTMKKNKSFNFSSAEEEAFNVLKAIFKDVKREYYCDRYPFKCDFYIPSEDLFIELNLHWTHNNHFFNKDSKEDKLTLEYWEDKSKTSEYYKNAIYVWTKRDLLKKETAIKNKLNYLVFWDKDLRDFYDWIESINYEN